MRPYLKLAALFFGAIALVPLIVGLIGPFDEVLGIILIIFGLPATLLALGIGGVVFFVHGIRCAGRVPERREQLAAVLASPVLTVAVLVAAMPLLALGRTIGDRTRLVFDRPHYDAIVAAVRAAPNAASRAEDRGVTYVVDAGPPVRVAFERVGFGDNWSAVVFDPTGEVMLAEGFDRATGRLTGPGRIAELFGGDLVGCRHLWDDYYRCSFT